MSFKYRRFWKGDGLNTRLNDLFLLKRNRVVMLSVILMVATIMSCKDKLELFNITRVPSFTFSLDNLNNQTGKEVVFTRGKSTLHYYPTGEVVLYNRCLMQVSGTTTAGKKFTVSIEFDLLKQDNYIGIYKPTYVPGVGGINSFAYLEETSANVYKSYNIDPEAIDAIYFRIQKQNQSEKLILGDFLAKLRNDQNPSDKIIFYQGTFNDIFYGALSL